MKRIGVFTSGGDAPGMNACLRAVVKTACADGLEVFGIRHGYRGMIAGDIRALDPAAVSNMLQRGGTLLKTARSPEFATAEGRARAWAHLQQWGIEGLVAIGGDGTFTGAEVFSREHGIPIVGAPATIDNDLYGSDFTIGFDTAINTALDAIDKVRDTANSHDRVFFIEVMGHHAGHIAIHCGIGGGAEFVMVPETATSIEQLIAALNRGRDHDKTSFIVIVAEGGALGDAEVIAARVGEELPALDIRVSKLGHVQRGGAPTAADRLLASRLGNAAVEALVGGASGVMLGVCNDRITHTPFEQAIHTQKPIAAELLKLVDVLSSS
ncbi:6-phosphofructokinase [Mangrovimicrobium sediminis]|uniref:ATP-dependent 6-phosphofructokinase n=1 Tax=Mangrovimicrobium sediminis TaxID=2562682 RepID=A0A4Z0LWI8_9GAMM|nr:6-phosphofructokinase [Haliea sp. SAOS-164]TGD71773.1 6-phosphofructokinase [Haliea sp. SAOS-164]